MNGDNSDDRGPPLPRGCSSAADTSQLCQQAKQHQDKSNERSQSRISICLQGVNIDTVSLLTLQRREPSHILLQLDVWYNA